VRSASFSPDGACIITASYDRTARIWDASSGEEIVCLRGHEDWVQSAAFLPDPARIVTASEDRTARIWNGRTGEQITCIVLDAGVGALAVSRNALALGDRLGTLHVFDVA
jgi:WD40 repeat protein